MSDLSWFYLSFADPHLPKGTQFLGGLYIEAESQLDAVSRAHATGQNPGGEVRTWGPLPIILLDAEVGPELRGRLLSREEIPGAVLAP